MRKTGWATALLGVEAITAIAGAAGGKPTPTPETPAPRVRGGFTGNGSDTDSRLYLFSGTRLSGREFYLDDLWYYRIAQSPAWTKVTPTSRRKPGGRVFPGWSCGHGTCLLNGGLYAGYMPPNSWTYTEDTRAWSELDCRSVSCPPPRYAPAQAYDGVRAEHVLFGGASNASGQTVALADTYTFANGTWTAKSPASSPPARAYAATAFVRDKGVVVYGGSDIGSTLNDMWVWNGSTWTEVAQSGGPALRRATMAWTLSNRLLVTNGYRDSAWNENSWYFTFSDSGLSGTWSKALGHGGCTTTGSDPAIHEEASMTFDLDANTQVFFGGFKSPTVFGNTVQCSAP
jgi:hypothetical protein